MFSLTKIADVLCCYYALSGTSMHINIRERINLIKYALY